MKNEENSEDHGPEIGYHEKEENGLHDPHSQWRWMSYETQLNTPMWQRRRLEIFQRDDWKCQACGSETNMLHVHHKGYRGKAWEAPDGALITLCLYCHQKEEALKEKMAPRLVNGFGVNGFLSTDIEKLSEIMNNLCYDKSTVSKIIDFVASLKQNGKAIR